mgnify:CR=1 FL=1
MNTTNNLNLNKHDNVSTNTDAFDVEKYLNENLDIIDNAIGKINENILDLQTDNVSNKEDISLIKQNNTAQDNKIKEIEDKNSEQDTNIKTNQEDIKALQEENAEVKAENERLKSDIESISLVGEAEGESIDLNDSSGARFRKFGIGGNHKQETREGYNLLDFNVTQDGRVTVNKDGTITINGTGGFAIKFKEFEYKKGVTYKAKATLVSGTYTSFNINHIGIMTPFGDNIWLANDIFKTNTFLEDTVRSSIWVGENCVFNNATFRIYSYEGTDDKDFEQYGAMPSTDFPSEIKTVGGNINLLNNTLQSQTINGLTVTVNDDKSVKIVGTATSNTNLVFDRHDGKLAAGTYTLKDCKTFIESTENQGWWVEGQTRTFTSEATLSKSGFYKYYSANTTVNETIYPMLAKGTMATSYVQYNQGSVEVKVVNKNLFDKNNANVVDFFVDGENKIQSWAGEVGTVYISINPNTTYTVSKKVSSRFTVATSKEVPAVGVEVNAVSNRTASNLTITSRDDDKYLLIFYYKKSDDALSAKEIRDSIQTERGSTATDFVEHQEQTITMPVQQEMLQGDYFGWKNEKEVHGWNKKIFDGTENINISTRGNSFLCRLTDILSDTKENQIPLIICNMYKTVSWQNRDVNNIEKSISQYGLNVGFDKGDLTTVEEFKALLKSKYDAGTPVEVYYKLAVANELAFTDEQKAIAKQIKETLHTYKNVTHVYSDDEVSPIVSVEYAKDLNTQNNNLQNQIDEIKQLISTTQTSAMLLDNLQKEVESEVE